MEDLSSPYLPPETAIQDCSPSVPDILHLFLLPGREDDLGEVPADLVAGRLLLHNVLRHVFHLRREGLLYCTLSLEVVYTEEYVCLFVLHVMDYCTAH